VLGWEELELEVVRDSKNQMITVCFIENVDAMGVHTGDSYCTAPMLTISEELQQRLQKYSYDIVEAIQVIGGTNVQFAHDPETDRVVVIEINPRTSRSSALASKATGFPIALISSLLAGGLTLDEIPYWRDGTLEKYTPSGDYVVAKFSRWAFEKFEGLQDKLGTQMRAVGEVMSIGKNYKEAFQKAIRSREDGRHGLGFAKDYHRKSLAELLGLLAEASSERQFIMYEALRQGADVQTLHEKTHIKAWFIEQMKDLVELEEKILKFKGKTLPDELLIQAKKGGFADRYLAQLLGVKETQIREQRKKLDTVEGWHPVPVSGVEDAAYYYSTYNAPDVTDVSPNRKIMVLGGGPNRIGQGIEFDYCCVHAAFALRDEGIESIMVNCNPETVSTDYDTSNKLYFEPLTVEDVLSIYEKEKPEGVICQFGGQTPLNIAGELEAAGVKIVGTTPDAIELAEDRDRFRQKMQKLGIPQPESGMASTLEEALDIAAQIGYPLMVRPSFVLGGRAMEVVHDEEMLKHYMQAAVDVSPERPILIDKFLENAIEAEADAIADGTDAFVPAVMEHIELAGIHSGDSACVIPPTTIPQKHIETICEYTRIRHLQRRSLYPGGESACQPHGAVGEQSLWPVHGARRHAVDAGQETGGSRPQAARHPALWGQRIRLPVLLLSGSGPRARPGNAIHRRGAGHGRLVRPGLLQGPGRGPGALAHRGNRADHGSRQGQGSRRRGGPPVCRPRFPAQGHGGNAGVPRPTWHRSRTRVQDARAAAAHRRPGHERRHPARDQYAQGQGQQGRRFLHPQGRDPYITTIAAALAAAKGIAAIKERQPDIKSLQEYHAGIK